MNLGQLRREVRRILQEPTAALWEDDELNDYLNEAATVMTADCQPLQAVTALTSVSGQQEYILPEDTDEVFAVSYQISNVLSPLEPGNPRLGSEASKFLGIPAQFYVRAQTNQIMQRSSDGLLDLDPVNVDKPTSVRKVLGLNPVPSETGKQIAIQFYANHYRMKTDLDIPVIPLFAQRGLIAYAVAQAKYKEQGYAEIGQVYMPIFNDFTKKLRTKNLDRGIQMRGHHKAYVPGIESHPTGGTDVIYLPWSS